MGMDIKIEKKRGLKRHHILIAVATIAVGYLLYYTFALEHLSIYRADRDRVTISTVKSDKFNDYIRLVSNVEPISIIFLDAVEGGRVEEKVVEEGAMVKKGDIILKLSNPDLNLSILSSQAKLAEQENFLRNTMVALEQQRITNRQQLINSEYDVIRKKRAMEQNSALYRDGLISKEQYLCAQEDSEIAQKQYSLKIEQYKQDSIYRTIQVESMNQNLSTMRENLNLVLQRIENLNVKAPIDGQLGFLDAELGQSIGRGIRIGQVNVLTNYKVVAQIDEHYIERIKRGLEADMEREGTTYNLHVKKVYPDVREGKFQVDMVFSDNHPENIRTGQTYHTRLKLGQSSDAIILPKGSFFQSTGGQWVFVLDKSEEFAIKRQVKIGRQNPTYYEVIEGLDAGEKVITSGYELFGDSEKIQFE